LAGGLGGAAAHLQPTGQDAVTRYHFNSTWDFVDSVVTPTGRSTSMSYDPANGNRLWQQVGSDAARRVQFRYGNTLGLLSSIVFPGTPPDSIEYSGMGNVSIARSPKGFDTRYTADGIGRDTMIEVRLDTLAAIYQKLPSVDFSHDLLEPQATKLRVLGVPPCGWNDLGTPRRVVETLLQPPAEFERADSLPFPSAALSLADQYGRLSRGNGSNLPL